MPKTRFGPSDKKPQNNERDKLCQKSTLPMAESKLFMALLFVTQKRPHNQRFSRACVACCNAL